MVDSADAKAIIEKPLRLPEDSLYRVGLIREVVIGFVCPERAAPSVQSPLLMSGAMLCGPARPPVVEIKVPSLDQESLLNRLCDMACDL